MKKNYHKFILKENSPTLEVISSQKLLILIFIVGFAASDIYVFIYLFFNVYFSYYFLYNLLLGTGFIFIGALYDYS